MAHSAEMPDAVTRRRVLEAAGEVFAQKGFKTATIRDICQKADANVAAVNYHFGDKQKLYAHVLRHCHACAFEKHPPDFGVNEKSLPQERLCAFIRAILNRMFDDGRPAWLDKLMTHEMVEPTEALDYLVQEQIRPQQQRLVGILREIFGPRANEKLLRNCVQSIVGQCVFFYLARPMLSRLYPNQRFDSVGVKERAEYICQFTLAALREMSKSSKTPRRKRVKR